MQVRNLISGKGTFKTVFSCSFKGFNRFSLNFYKLLEIPTIKRYLNKLRVCRRKVCLNYIRNGE